MDDEGYQEGLEHWRRKGPIGKLRNIAKFIRASPQRGEAFRNVIQEWDESEDFIFSEASSRELELRQNNATRWNSTYLMIQRAWEKQAEIWAYLWKALYDDPATELAAELASQKPSEPLSPGSGPDAIPRPSPPTTPARDRPARQSRLPQHLQGFEVATPLRQQQQPSHRHPAAAASATAQFNEAALPDHARPAYMARSVSRISSLAADERTYLKEYLEEWYSTVEVEDSLKETPTPSPSPMMSAKRRRIQADS
ncbi:predicted protein [Chaetomium globosum CBS 148.51]|uniref:Uncharacterized protein n=1 Tax=Chaetomium globosum (strain ATCC 6205 / CBS 148.51 / DSM 1962 / NBRC 6347 / NRRL 1970) TaxID=306901 RepID=Q2H7V5_CHAGB|nr:uncharacterized protein CHGG_03699 [Chaetomium globosum CBS 148.51]EAQ91764.1 predicted protein [Chaetomium globosum CBS 148.51]